MELFIDTRESYLCSNLNLPFKSANLDVGDILYKINDENILLIERKTYADLANAIQSGRHDEQKARIHAFDCKIKIYLIEGQILTAKNGIPQSSIDSAILGMVIRDGMYILYSRSIEMTVQIIMKIHEKLGLYLKEREDILSGNLKYVGPIYSIRKENLNPNSCYIAQLSCYPGISNKIAKTIESVYKNFPSLITASVEDLINLNIVSDDGKTKKLGLVGQRLHEYLHDKKDDIPKKIQIQIKKK